MFELSKQFQFDAAHTLQRKIGTEGSRRVHGHSYRAEVAVRGMPDPATGMIVDLGYVDQMLAELREQLDHHMLDDIPDLGPATVENLSAWIWAKLSSKLPSLYRVSVFRDSFGDRCSYYGPSGRGV